ncbi:MAG: diacylglycerol/polyprenol kinase family protein [Candidatus Odinarchaeota archaeon]
MVFNLLGPGLELVWDIIAMVISIIAVMLVVLVNGAIQKSGKLSSDVTRKIVHIFAAPVFLVTWYLYSGTLFSRYLALIVPVLFVLLFVGIGTGKVVNEAFVGSMSRSGDPKELLKGTLYYALIICIVTLLWFYSPAGNPTAFVILGCLAGGDGLADVIGRKFGGAKKFGVGGAEKTVAGSIGMLIGSFLFSYILIAIFSLEYASFDLVLLFLPVLVISIVATIVEALTPKNLDNWTVPIAVIVVILLFINLIPAWWPFALLTI